MSLISQENTCVGVSQLQRYQKEIPTQVFFCEIFKNTFFLKNTSSCCFFTMGTTVFENIAVRTRKKHSHIKVSYNYLEYPTQLDHNSRRSQYSHVFFTVENLRKPLLLVTHRNQVFLYIHFYIKNKKVS